MKMAVIGSFVCFFIGDHTTWFIGDYHTLWGLLLVNTSGARSQGDPIGRTLPSCSFGV